MYGLLSYICVLVTLTHGSEINSTGDNELNLPIPSIYGISDFEVNGPIIHWLPVKQSGDEPVLGYKAKLWEVGCVTKLKHKTINGETVQVRERVMPRLRDYSTLRNLKEFNLVGAKNSSLFLKDLPKDIPYHVMVSAYSASGSGPLSSPFRFQVEGRYKCRED